MFYDATCLSQLVPGIQSFRTPLDRDLLKGRIEEGVLSGYTLSVMLTKLLHIKSDVPLDKEYHSDKKTEC